jgi:hypothetical protein
MLSTDRAIKRLAFLACTCLATALAACAQTTTLGCPRTITVTEAAAPIKGWKVTGGHVDHPFERVSVYNGKEGVGSLNLRRTARKRVRGRWSKPGI